MRSRIWSLLFSGLALTGLTQTGLSYAQTPSSEDIVGGELKFTSCQISASSQSVDAQCAKLTRAENPNQPDGKTIELFVAKIPALSPKPEADAFTVIQGGPGASSIDFFISSRSAFEAIRRKRDILIVDQRGTGRSNKLGCPVQDETEAFEFDPLLAKRAAEECLSLLTNDPRFFTTSIAVQDLDAVREAAGYEQLSLYGVSYGTRVAQHYLRRFPERTRSVIIDGVAPVDWILGGDIARFSQDAFDDLAARCSEDAACADRFGDLKAKFAEVRARVKERPVEVSLRHPLTGRPETVTVGEVHLLMTVRLFAYSTEQLALLPLIIDSAANGDYLPLAAQSKMVGDDFNEIFAAGMHNAVVCAEDVPFMTEADLRDLDQTYFGTVMVDSLRAVCEVWPQGPIDEDFKQPISFDTPVLVLSGEVDPVTPPSNGEAAANMFRNSKHITVPGHGHGVIGRGCMPQLAAQFVTDASVQNLDAECVERQGPMPFFVDFTGSQP